jgi:hypothetical protein
MIKGHLTKEEAAEHYRKRLEEGGIGLKADGDLNIVWPPLNPIRPLLIVPDKPLPTRR